MESWILCDAEACDQSGPCWEARLLLNGWLLAYEVQQTYESLHY